MNLEEVIKECEQLQTSIERTEPCQKGFPHIVSKESFERMIATTEDHLHCIDPQSPPTSSNCSTKVKMTPQGIQQTSVIIANNGIPKTARSRKFSMQRQARFDDTADLADNDCNNEKSFVKENDSESPKIVFKNFINRSSTFDAGHAFEKRRSFDKCRSHSSDGHCDSYGSLAYDSGEHLSKLASKGVNYPLLISKQTNHSFDSDDQASFNMNSLHISPTQHYYQDPYCSLHSSSRESLIESPTNSIRNTSARRLHDTQYDNTHERTSPVIPPSPGVRASNCRSYESQQYRQYKYCQRRALSLNTAPYHQLNSEQNLRRILSEEIVAENPMIDCIRRANLPNSKLRRAASYDTFDDMGRDSHIPNYALEREGQLPLQLPNQTQAPTKIMFPEHANIKEHINIFTQNIEDDNTHLLNVHRMMEKSVFGPELEINFRQNHISNFNVNIDKEIKSENQSHIKSKVNKTQNENNHTIGPYEYDPKKDDDVAVCVSGLLTLPGSNEKRYPITVGELRRRIAPPEYLNKVDMISYVRLAKTSARELLEKYEIRPKHHSRKSKHSVISKMCEAECAELANGVNTLSDVYFPGEWLAKLSILSKREEGSRNEVTEILTKQKSRVDTAKSVLQEFLVVLENNKGANEMQDYNLATHSYGFLDLSNNIKLITSFLECQHKMLTNKINSIDPDSRSTYSAPMDTDVEAKTVDTKVEDET